jgi:hypothetical protein
MNYDTTIPARKLAELSEGQRAQLLAKGMVHQRILHINHRDYLAVLRQGPVLVPEKPAVLVRMEAERAAICAACEWNVDNICEHPGCAPCRMRGNGGLSEAIKRPRFKCAAHKHPKIL